MKKSMAQSKIPMGQEPTPQDQTQNNINI